MLAVWINKGWQSWIGGAGDKDQGIYNIGRRSGGFALWTMRWTLLAREKLLLSWTCKKQTSKFAFPFFSVLFALSFCFSRSDLETLGNVNECIVQWHVESSFPLNYYVFGMRLIQFSRIALFCFLWKILTAGAVSKGLFRFSLEMLTCK